MNRWFCCTIIATCYMCHSIMYCSDSVTTEYLLLSDVSWHMSALFTWLLHNKCSFCGSFTNSFQFSNCPTIWMTSENRHKVANMWLITSMYVITTSRSFILPLKVFPKALFSALYFLSCTLHLSVLWSRPFPLTTTFMQMTLSSSSLSTHSVLTQAFLTFKTLFNISLPGRLLICLL